MKTVLNRLLVVGLITLLVASSMTMLMPGNSPSMDLNVDVPDVLNDDVHELLRLDDLNYTNNYAKIFEPNNIRGSTHAIATSESNNYIALAGGYLSDNEIHIYGWNSVLQEYVHAWSAGDGIITSDVLDVQFMDCELRL
jgi:hypothetical protein